MPKLPAFLLAATLLFVAPSALAVQPTGCPAVDGIQCDGWVTDAAGVLRDDANLERLVDGLVNQYGNQIAVVIVQSAADPNDLARRIGNEWGVGNADVDDGIVVLVALDQRLTAVETGPGFDLPEADIIASLGDSSFAAGDFDGGVSAIVGGLNATFQADATGEDRPFERSGIGSGVVVAGLALVAGAGFLVFQSRQSRATRRRGRRRAQESQVDDALEGLKPFGHELSLRDELFEPRPVEAPDMPTGRVVSVLERLLDGAAPDDVAALDAAWSAGFLEVLHEDRVNRERELPLELEITGEQQLLEDAVQSAAQAATDAETDDEFSVRLNELSALVTSLRPYRVAEERTRTARRLIHRSVPTPIGPVIVSDDGERLVQAAPALMADAPILASRNEVDSAYETARDKAARLLTIRDRLADNEARPAVSAALVDLEDDPDLAIKRYEELQTALERTPLAADGLSVPAVAAFLLMNNDDVGEFTEAYAEARALGYEPQVAVETAMAGLRSASEIEEVRQEASELNLPVAIAAALLDRGDQSVAAYHQLTGELSAYGLEAESRRTIAALLAISLEPAQALRRWVDARDALARLGLVGSYADTAAAFGASDPRGPRAFAVAYAAQRQALARSGIEDADRYAPELAHSGTRRGRDTWTGEPLAPGLRMFDPFTLLYYHWVITGGTGYGHGWEPIYRDNSWSGDRDSWFGGGGGFGDSGSWSGSSSWGSSWGGSSGGFGGWGGGGGFGGFGGSGGSSGW